MAAEADCGFDDDSKWQYLKLTGAGESVAGMVIAWEDVQAPNLAKTVACFLKDH